MSKELTGKQKQFCIEYLVDLNATQAAIRAGYSAKTAQEQSSRLLSNVIVSQHIQQLMNERAKKVSVDSEYVLKTIVETVERCKQAYPVLDRKGEQVYVRVGDDDNAPLAPAFTFDSGAVLKGAELLGKHLKLFTDKTELTGANGGAIEMKVDATLSPSDAYLKMLGKK
jgi:phage terminase small subunit